MFCRPSLKPPGFPFPPRFKVSLCCLSSDPSPARNQPPARLPRLRPVDQHRQPRVTIGPPTPKPITRIAPSDGALCAPCAPENISSLKPRTRNFTTSRPIQRPRTIYSHLLPPSAAH